MSVDTLQNLEDLLASKGWLWLMEQYDAHWGAEAFLNKLQQIEHNDKLTDETRRWHAQQAWAGKRAIDGFVALAKAEVQTLRRAYQSSHEETMSRRGPGL